MPRGETKTQKLTQEQRDTLAEVITEDDGANVKAAAKDALVSTEAFLLAGYGVPVSERNAVLIGRYLEMLEARAQRSP